MNKLTYLSAATVLAAGVATPGLASAAAAPATPSPATPSPCTTSTGTVKLDPGSPVTQERTSTVSVWWQGTNYKTSFTWHFTPNPATFHLDTVPSFAGTPLALRFSNKNHANYHASGDTVQIRWLANRDNGGTVLIYRVYRTQCGPDVQPS